MRSNSFSPALYWRWPWPRCAAFQARFNQVGPAHLSKQMSAGTTWGFCLLMASGARPLRRRSQEALPAWCGSRRKWETCAWLPRPRSHRLFLISYELACAGFCFCICGDQGWFRSLGLKGKARRFFCTRQQERTWFSGRGQPWANGFDKTWFETEMCLETVSKWRKVYILWVTGLTVRL